MKTPMQELIDEMQKSPLMFASALALIEEMRMLEKEKAVIIDAYNKVSMNTGEQYYNETFNTK